MFLYISSIEYIIFVKSGYLVIARIKGACRCRNLFELIEVVHCSGLLKERRLSNLTYTPILAFSINNAFIYILTMIYCNKINKIKTLNKSEQLFQMNI